MNETDNSGLVMKLWEPSAREVEKARVSQLIKEVENKYSENFPDFHSFQQWTASNPIPFWETMWDSLEIVHSRAYDSVLENAEDMMRAQWFTGARLNFAENLLRFNDEQEAIVFWNEFGRQESISYQQLWHEVAKIAAALRNYGIKPGDRIAAYVPNFPHSIYYMLAATSVGAVWSSCSPDFSVSGVLARFQQIDPRIFIIADGYFYKEKQFSSLPNAKDIIAQLPSVEKTIVVPYADQDPDLSSIPNAELHQEFTATFKNTSKIQFEQLPSNHPVYILYSSGTTGAPKCIVHSAIGMLMGTKKEHAYESDLRREDRFFYGTTCGWMMWNWLVGGLGFGSTLLLYDGFPLARDGKILFDIAEEEKMTIFGTSAGYLQKIEELGLKPKETHDLSSIRAMYSTGSRLKPESFDYVYRDIGNFLLCPIWGGTDLCGVLGGSSPVLAVHRDEIQTRGLGLAVDIFDDNANPTCGKPGEVVVKAPFPNMPVYFLNDPDGEKYRKAYFNNFNNTWRHGDWGILTERNGLIILGRSDDTLNPGGVRIGAAEVTGPAEAHAEVVEAMAAPLYINGDENIILFVILAPEQQLTPELKKTISQAMPSPRHRPRAIIQVHDFPTTASGKRSGRAIRDLINGKDVPNAHALANPDSLEFFKKIPELTELTS